MYLVSYHRKTKLLKKAIGERIRELRVKADYTSYETFAIDNDLPRKNYCV